jgi:Dodecin
MNEENRNGSESKVVGTSKESFAKAAENAVKEAAKTVRGLKWVRVPDWKWNWTARILPNTVQQRTFTSTLNSNSRHLLWSICDWEALMKNHAVTLGVKPCLRIQCKFWLGEDGWNGSAEHPSITVQASSFEQAKSDMEVALGRHIELLLRESQPASAGKAA